MSVPNKNIYCFNIEFKFLSTGIELLLETVFCTYFYIELNINYKEVYNVVIR